MNKFGAISAQMLFWMLLCPDCDFETHLSMIGYTNIGYGETIIHDCPKCKIKIIKTVGKDLGKAYVKNNISSLAEETA